MRIAAESGEIDGTTWGWDSMRGTWQKALESGTVVVVLQTVPKAFADWPGCRSPSISPRRWKPNN